MDEALLSEAIHHGFLFRKRSLGGEQDGTEPDNGRQKDAQTKLVHLNHRTLLNREEVKLYLFQQVESTLRWLHLTPRRKGFDVSPFLSLCECV